MRHFFALILILNTCWLYAQTRLIAEVNLGVLQKNYEEPAVLRGYQSGRAELGSNGILEVSARRDWWQVGILFQQYTDRYMYDCAYRIRSSNDYPMSWGIPIAQTSRYVVGYPELGCTYRFKGKRKYQRIGISGKAHFVEKEKFSVFVGLNVTKAFLKTIKTHLTPNESPFTEISTSQKPGYRGNLRGVSIGTSLGVTYTFTSRLRAIAQLHGHQSSLKYGDFYLGANLGLSFDLIKSGK